MSEENPKKARDWPNIEPELKALLEVQRGGVIGDNANQARWTRAQEIHNLGDDSATSLFYKPGERSAATEKFELFDSKEKLALLDKQPAKLEKISAVPVDPLHRAESSTYSEPPAEAANKTVSHWNPDTGLLNILDSSSWSKLQLYAGDVGRAHGWSKEHKGTFAQVNALTHALATVDINNNLAGAKIAQDIRAKGGSWLDVELDIVAAVKQIDPSGRIPQPNVTLHNFLNQP